jgi:hypothetical protein
LSTFDCVDYTIRFILKIKASSEDYYETLTGDLENTIAGRKQNILSDFSLVALHVIDLLSTSSSNETKELNAIINARRLYKSCVEQDKLETDDIDTILKLIDNELGGWPVLQGSSWDNSAFNFSQQLIKLNTNSNYIIFLAVTLVDDKNSSIQGIRVRSNICEQL